jgi:hypothetical protein
MNMRTGAKSHLTFNVLPRRVKYFCATLYISHIQFSLHMAGKYYTRKLTETALCVINVTVFINISF